MIETRTWDDVFRFFDPDITPEHEYEIMWTETCYPFGTVRQIIYQIRSAIRARKNHVKRCDMCGMMVPFHRPGCPEKEVSNG